MNIYINAPVYAVAKDKGVVEYYDAPLSADGVN
jgi:hypothetical protein